MKIAKDDRPEQSYDVLKAGKPEMIDQPQTVDEALNLLISKLSLKDKSAIAQMSEDDLSNLHFSFGLYIRNRLLYPRNEKLLESCRQEAMDKYLHWDQASTIIIKRLWDKLRGTHKLRVLK